MNLNIDRRTFLCLIGYFYTANLFAKTKCKKTPIQPIGPFYKKTKLSNINDLTNNGKALGKIIEIQGKIVDRNCKPHPKCIIDIWQANSYGKYNHKNDLSENKIDKYFKGYKRIITDDAGFYSFKTIMPGSYKIFNDIIRPPHIHLLIKTVNNKKLSTQVYFKDQLGNKKDIIFNSVKNNYLLEVSLVKSDKKIKKGTLDITI